MARNRTKSTAKRIVYVFLIVIVLLGIANYARPLPSIAANPTTISSEIGSSTLDWPQDGASAAIGANGYGVLSTQSDISLPTASIAKLITALTVLNAKPLKLGQQGPNITITPEDVTIYNNYVAQDGSVVAVQAGETITEYQALQAMLIPSANNIADALAIWAFGSLEAYASAATTEAQTLSLLHTSIGSDASGLSPSTTSSPSDLVIVGSAVMNNPVLTQIVAQPSVTLPIAGQVINVNSLLGKYGINGIKTGNSDQAGGNFLFSAPFSIGGHNITIIGDVLHASDLQNAIQDSIPLLASAKREFIVKKPVSAGQYLGIYIAPWGEKASAVAKNDLDVVTWKGTTLTPTLRLSSLTRGEAAGTQVGAVTVSSGTFKVSEPVILKQTFSPPTIWWRVTRH
jgi:D-alanyl-D-alanine carboxypeptidase (penicillin-binding protein 5/6)